MQPLLQLKGIDKAFPGVKALSGAALSVYPGKVMALVGENGAGKSTMMKVLTGIYQKDAGSQYFLGKEVAFNGPKDSQEAGIGIIHQELNLIPQLTIAENIFLGREFVNRFGRIDWKRMYAEADRLLARLNLRYSSHRLVGELSIGDQQMVGDRQGAELRIESDHHGRTDRCADRHRNCLAVQGDQRAEGRRARHRVYLAPPERDFLKSATT